MALALVACAARADVPAPLAIPTVAPHVAPVSGVAWPSAARYDLFAASALRVPLRHPRPDPSDGAWRAAGGLQDVDPFIVAADPSGDARDPSEPLYYCTPHGSGCASYVVHCTLYTCPGAEGKPFSCPAAAVPQGVTDGHVTCIDLATHVVTSLWEAKPNPGAGAWPASFAGQCASDGTATDCGSTASDIPVAIGLISARRLLGPERELPYALQAAQRCESAAYRAPATASDGHDPGCPPAGTRIYLDMSDAEIDATALPETAKKIWRTLDREHYGAILTDTNPFAHGLSIQVESPLTYTRFGRPNPWRAIAAGWDESAANGLYDLRIPHDGIDLGRLRYADAGVTSGR